jgi:hypothetical protein
MSEFYIMPNGKRSTILFLERQRLSPSVIRKQLIAVLGPDATGFSTIPRYLNGPLRSPDQEAMPMSTSPDIFDQAIRRAVDE